MAGKRPAVEEHHRADFDYRNKPWDNGCDSADLSSGTEYPTPSGTVRHTREQELWERTRNTIFCLVRYASGSGGTEEDGAQYDGWTCGTSRTDGTGSSYSGSDNDAPTFRAGHYPCCAATVCLSQRRRWRYSGHGRICRRNPFARWSGKRNDT